MKKTVVIVLLLVLGVIYLVYSSNSFEFEKNPLSKTSSSKQTIRTNNVDVKTTSKTVANIDSNLTNAKKYTTNQPAMQSSEFSPFNRNLLAAYNLTTSSTPSCGDGVCHVSENHSTCARDCPYYAGVREVDGICGDYVCASQEKLKGNCCIDCGCATGRVCNFEKLSCQIALPPFSQGKLREVQSTITASNSIYANYTAVSVEDDVLNGTSVKVITLQCPGDLDFPCYHLAIVNQKGDILSELDTV